MIDPKCAKCKQKYCYEGITDESLLPTFCPVKNFKGLIQEVKEKYSTEEIHHFERFLAEYENRFEREYGYFRPIIKEVTAGHHEAWKADSITSLLFRMACLLRCLLGRSSLFSLGKS